MMFRSPVNSDQLRRAYPAIFAESEKDTLSDKYLYIPTYKLIECLTREGFSIIGAKQSGSRMGNNRDHAKHVVYLTHNSFSGNNLKVGEEMPMLALTNSHNGLSSFGIDTAFFRLACSNGLLMPTNSLNSARIVHKIGMQDDVINAAYRVVSEFPKQIAQIDNMKGINLSQDERHLLAETATRLVFDESQINLNKSLGRDIAPKLLTVRRHADQKHDLWTAFNVIQENVIKGGISVVTENERGAWSWTRTRGVNAIDRDAKLNKELMSLAQRFAELKQGAA